MKSESLMLLTVAFSVIYFGLMKYEMSQPWDIIKLTIVGLATLAFVIWLMVSYLAADDITTEEDKNN